MTQTTKYPINTSQTNDRIFNVRDNKYGAKGDGVTDDTIAIQSAINDCADVGGGIVYIPFGVYNTGFLYINEARHSDITIRGDGIGATTILNGAIIKNNSVETRNIVIKDLTIDVNGEAHGAINLANLSYDFLIENVELKDTAEGFLIYWAGVDNLIVRNSYFIDAGTSVSADLCAGGQIVGNGGTTTFESNYFEYTDKAKGSGLLTTGSTGNLIVRNNTFVNKADKGYAGVSIENFGNNSDSIVIDGNYFLGCGINVGISAFDTNQVEQCIVVNNKIEGYDGGSGFGDNGGGIQLTNCRQGVVDGNILKNTNYGVFVATPFGLHSSSIISNNFIYNTNSNNSVFSSDKSGIFVSEVENVLLDANIIISDNSLTNTGIQLNTSNGTNSVFSIRNNHISGSFKSGDPISFFGNFTTGELHFSNNYTDDFVGSIPATYKKFTSVNSGGINPDSYFDAGNKNGAFTLYRYNGILQKVTLTGNSILDIEHFSPKAIEGSTITIEVVQDGTGGYTLGFSGDVKVAGGSLVVASGAGDKTLITFMFNGSTWQEISRSLDNS